MQSFKNFVINESGIFPGNDIGARVGAKRQAQKRSIEANHPIEHHIHNALKNKFETHDGKIVKGALLNDIHDHVKEWGGFNISKKKLEDHLDGMRDIKHVEGHSHAGWTRKGQTKRSKARFYTAGKEYESDK